MNLVQQHVTCRRFLVWSIAALALTVLVASPALAGQKTRPQLKDEFQNGDIPNQDDFADVIDSLIHLGEDRELIGMRAGPDGRAALLPVGTEIGPGSFYGPAAGLSDDWIGQSGFLGLSFEEDSQTHYGYLQITAAGGPGATSPYPMFVEYFVYDDEPGVALTTHFVPEPGTAIAAMMGGLAMVWVVRRQRCST